MKMFFHSFKLFKIQLIKKNTNFFSKACVLFSENRTLCRKYILSNSIQLFVIKDKAVFRTNGISLEIYSNYNSKKYIKKRGL